MDRYLARSTRYLDLMKRVLKQNGVPEELVFVAMIESGFSFSAKSHAGAVGYWQFIRGTGKRYGLKINSFIDERRDPILSTTAAAQYLRGLYSLFGSWELAMAAYNVGENRVQKVLMNNYTRDYWEMAARRLLPAETLSYVPKFVAASLIAKNPAKYGFNDVEYYEPFTFEEVTLEKPVNLRVLAGKLGVSYADFKMFNPAFKGDYAPLGPDRKVVIRVPNGGKSIVQASLDQATVKSNRLVVTYDTGDHDYVFYKIRRGDNLFRIAQKYGVSQTSILKLNNFSHQTTLRVGSRIKIPAEAAERETPSPGREPSSKRAKESNNNSHVFASKRLPVVVRASRPTGRYAHVDMKPHKIHIVRRGETLTHIAEKYCLPLVKLAKANKLPRTARLVAGTQLMIPKM